MCIRDRSSEVQDEQDVTDRQHESSASDQANQYNSTEDTAHEDDSRANIISENTPSPSSNDSTKVDTTHSDSRANSAVEASTEKAHPESDQDELKASSRYSSN